MLTDNPDTRFEQEIRNRVEMIFENYTLDEILEMNDLSEQEAIYLLFTEGHISEPEAFLP